MNKNAAERLCQRWLPAWSGNQPEALIEFYSEDTFYRDPARPEGLRGREALLGYLTKLLAMNPSWVWELVEVIPTAEGFTGKWKATIPAGSKTVVEYGLDIVEVRDGKITRNEVYFDRTGLLTAVAEVRGGR